MSIMQLLVKPDICLACRSSNLFRDVLTEVDLEGDLYRCGSCCQFFVIGNREIGGAIPAIRTCPHCSVGGLVTLDYTSGDEWCNNCGLDPNESATPLELAHLWKKGSGISKLMLAEPEIGMLRKGMRIGDYLKSSCGPHCTLAEECPQTVMNLVVCARESNQQEETEEMSKRRNKREGKKRFPNPFRGKPVPKTAVLFAKRGWLERTIHGTSHSESVGDTGS